LRVAIHTPYAVILVNTPILKEVYIIEPFFFLFLFLFLVCPGVDDDITL
jgi:hypothetical protein